MAVNDFVHVGCKMPGGVVLNLRINEVDRTNGVVTVMTTGEDVETVTLKGNSRKFDAQDISIDGYVFTRVPKDFWEEWLKRNASSSLLRDGFIKAAATMDAATKMAREMETRPGQYERLAEDDSKNRHHTPSELAARGAGLGVKKFDPKDDGARAAA